jgi:hypothetical protein
MGVLAMESLSAHADSSPAVPALRLQPRDCRIRPCSNIESYDYTSSAMTAAAARRYRVIVLRASDGDKVARLRAANPGVRILLYKLVLGCRTTDPLGVTACTPTPTTGPPSGLVPEGPERESN